ncbi:carbonic anhydrase [Halorubrum sp. BV1]|uniref:carbonic anhydrase n=1 Tax=Halorubrum sp. BV1 TaxID=1498500 RepID=UPI000679B7C4|nr:carbonic anhydrase [Halorubrum sp. BV1]
MSRRLLADLLDRNDAHVASLGAGALSAHRDGQRPPVVSVCCSDSRVSQERMWAADPGYLFTVGNIGNRVSTDVDGERVLSGSVAYPLCHTDTDVVVVVGHTGCGAVGAALDAARDGPIPTDPGIRSDVEDLLPIVERGLDAAVSETAAASVRNQLVEYNVHEQVALVRESNAAGDADVYGFVYDFHGAYGDRDGAAYLVNANGTREVDRLRGLVDDSHADRVSTLL